RQQVRICLAAPRDRRSHKEGGRRRGCWAPPRDCPSAAPWWGARRASRGPARGNFFFFPSGGGGRARRGVWCFPAHASPAGAVAPAEGRGVLRGIRLWPRFLHACGIEKLTAHGAAVIAFDLMFSTPDPANDDALAAALRKAGCVVLLQGLERRIIGAGSSIEI